MNLTRRTYRIVIARSIRKESRLRAIWHRATPGFESTDAHFRWLDQINHTRRLQQRKRKERK